MLYLDHRAGSPMRPEAVEALRRVALEPGNPSSIHQAGQRARRLVDAATRQVLTYLEVPAWELVWTGSVDEARELARGAKLPGGAEGLGEHDVRVAEPNLWGGPQGLAAVVTLRGVSLAPLWEGGGQQRGVRSGSLPVALIVAAGEASRVAHERREAELGRARDVMRHLAFVLRGLVDAGLAGPSSSVERDECVIELVRARTLDRLQASLDAVGLACAVEPGPRLVLTPGWSTTAEELAPLANMLQTALS